MNDNEWIFIKIFMDAIVSIEKETYKFVKKLEYKFNYFEINVEPIKSVMPFEDLIKVLNITDDSISYKFYDFIITEFFSSNYNDKVLRELFKRFATDTTDYKNVIKTLFMSLIKFDAEINDIINYIEKNNIFFEMCANQTKECIPVENLIRILKIPEDKRDSFIDEVINISYYSINQEKDTEIFLKKYNII